MGDVDTRPTVYPAPKHTAAPSALGLVGQAAVLAEVADQLGIGVAGIGSVGTTTSLTLAYGSGHAGMTSIFEACGIDDYTVDEYPLPGRTTYCATGQGGPRIDGIHVAVWFAEDVEAGLPVGEPVVETDET